ncbi:hypothetical protein NFI96_005374 [Prochilodus magdalenae]|nr:hypothetical protein NFI96_005374 [Prochilodus magdalenae]
MVQFPGAADRGRLEAQFKWVRKSEEAMRIIGSCAKQAHSVRLCVDTTMAEAVLPIQESSNCPVCLDLLKDPVTIPCGHSFCLGCIKDCWDQDDQTGVYRCPQCRHTFTPRPVLNKDTMLAELAEGLRKTRLQAAPPAGSPAGSGDVECDVCTGTKLKAVKSCLVCLASYCEAHIQTHYESPALQKHKLVEASMNLQEKICSLHDKLLEVFCRTDQQCICLLCVMNEHSGHKTVSAAAERSEKQGAIRNLYNRQVGMSCDTVVCYLQKQLVRNQRKFQQRIQQTEKRLQDLKQSMENLKGSAQAAVEDSEKIFTELIQSIERRRSEVKELIRAQERTELSQAEELLKKLEQEIADLRRRDAELEQLSDTEDPIHFLQSFQSLSAPPPSADLLRITISPQFSMEELKKAVTAVMERVKPEVVKFSGGIVVLSMTPATWRKPQETLQPSEPKTKDDFLKHSCQLTLDPNTANSQLALSERNSKVTVMRHSQAHPDHPERFERVQQVLCTESLTGRCYWEVELNKINSNSKSFAVSYKPISRKGKGNESKFGTMAEAVLQTQESLNCPICLDLLKDPVTIPCGHSFCLGCIKDCWDRDDQTGVYSCPQCRHTFTPRPVLNQNTMLAELAEGLRKTRLQAAPPAGSPAGSGDVECDVCTGTKHRAVKSCLVCLASYCEAHIQTHYESPAFKKHKLDDASMNLQEKICSLHDKLLEVFCRTDQQCICLLCVMDKHSGHKTVSAEAERSEKQKQLVENQRTYQQRIQQTENKLQELKQIMETIRTSSNRAPKREVKLWSWRNHVQHAQMEHWLLGAHTGALDCLIVLCGTLDGAVTQGGLGVLSRAQGGAVDIDSSRCSTKPQSSAQAAVEDSEKIFTELIQSIERRRSEVKELIRAQEKTELSQAEEFLKKLEKEIADLRRRNAEMEQLSHTEDHIHFLQSFQSLSAPPPSAGLPRITISPQFSMEELKKAVTGIKEQVELNVVSTVIEGLIPKTREDLLKYSSRITLDPNTAYKDLALSERNRKVTLMRHTQTHPDHPERFDAVWQVLCRESLTGRCYWEVEFSRNYVNIAVSYKDISRKGYNESRFGSNDQSWNLIRSGSSFSFRHNNEQTELPVKSSSSRIGVYVDHSAGILSFYSVSDTMTLLHRVHTTFTQPLYPGFGVYNDGVYPHGAALLQGSLDPAVCTGVWKNTEDTMAESGSTSGDVECDVCTGTKHKAVKSCLACLLSFCEAHIQPHYESPAYKKHKLVEASMNLQEKICSLHDKLLEIFCRTDQQFICYSCVMDEHSGHKTVSAAAERSEKQKQLVENQRTFQQRIQQTENKLQELKQAMENLKSSAQAAVEDSEKIYTELIQSIERRRSVVKELIRDQEKTELSQAEELMKKLEQEIADLRRRDAELEQLSHTEDPIHFLHSFQSLSAPPPSADLPRITISPQFSMEELKKAVTGIKQQVELNVVSTVIEGLIPKTREDLLK